MKYFLVFAVILAICPACQSVKKSEQPNILLVLVDDMGFSDLGCYGGEIQTPNLNKLASEGLRFTRFYNTAKCFPSRACLLTGLYAQHNGMQRKALTFTNAVTIAGVLRSAGYRTLMTGKHHGEENPYYFGFDRYFGLKDGSSNHFNPGLQREEEVPPAHKKGNFQPRAWGIEPQRNAPLFWQWANGKAIRKGKWKLVSDQNLPWELYDMETDQTETNDLINEHQEVAEELKTEWEKWLKESHLESE